MPELFNSNLFAVFAAVTFLLIVKAQILGAATAATRGRLGKFENEEDASWLGGQRVDTDDPKVSRVFRAHRNDLEQLLPFAVAGITFILAGGPQALGAAYFLVFFAARVTHSIAYLKKKARLRRDAFVVGWFTTILIAGHAVISVGGWQDRLAF
jgi:glutathione S-transferase